MLFFCPPSGGISLQYGRLRLKPGLVLLISLGLELALCTAIPVTGSFLEIVFHMGIITVCYGAFLGVILR